MLIAKVNAESPAAARVAREQRVQSYPTLRFWARGARADAPTAYEGARGERELVAWVNARAGTHRAVGGGLDAVAGTLAALDAAAAKVADAVAGAVAGAGAGAGAGASAGAGAGAGAAVEAAVAELEKTAQALLEPDAKKDAEEEEAEKDDSGRKSSVEYYLRVARKLRQNAGYAAKELARVSGLLAKGGVAPEKADDLTVRRNILDKFVREQKEEKEKEKEEL